MTETITHCKHILSIQVIPSSTHPECGADILLRDVPPSISSERVEEIDDSEIPLPHEVEHAIHHILLYVMILQTLQPKSNLNTTIQNSLTLFKIHY